MAHFYESYMMKVVVIMLVDNGMCMVFLKSFHFIILVIQLEFHLRFRTYSEIGLCRVLKFLFYFKSNIFQRYF